MKSRASSRKTYSPAIQKTSRSARRSTRRAWGLVSSTSPPSSSSSARTEFERAASISARIAADDPTHHAGRKGLIEAYLQIGRSLSFQGEYSPAETWFRKMQTLAAAWVTEEPGNHQARDLLASSLRKLADLKKFSKDYAGARQDYESAIAIGRDLMKLEPHNLDFKYHLAIALDDLAGVVRDQGELDRARRTLEDAERLCMELVESDPDHLQYRTSLLFTQLHRAGVERDLSLFTSAARVFRAVLDQMHRLEEEGRLESAHVSFINGTTLENEIAFCEGAPESACRRQLRSFEARGGDGASAAFSCPHACRPPACRDGPCHPRPEDRQSRGVVRHRTMPWRIDRRPGFRPVA